MGCAGAERCFARPGTGLQRGGSLPGEGRDLSTRKRGHRDSDYLVEMEARVRHYDVYPETSPIN